jgi:hypothetical protein
MKINKEQFKSIVKECLLEILSEGLNVQSQNVARPKIDEGHKRQRPSDLISYAKQQQPQQSLKKIKEQVSAVAGGDPVMASIFADTAQTTLPQMLQSEKSPRSSMVESNDPTDRLVASASPIDLFGEEAADKWSTLAFASAPNKIK